MIIKTGFMEIANRASLNSNTRSLDGITNRVSHHESSLNANAHQISNISGLQTQLNNKAPLSHSHTVSNISGLQNILDGKQDKLIGYNGNLTIVTSIDFANSTFETAQLNIVNGIIIEIN